MRVVIFALIRFQAKRFDHDRLVAAELLRHEGVLGLDGQSARKIGRSKLIGRSLTIDQIDSLGFFLLADLLRVILVGELKKCVFTFCQEAH